MKKILHWLDENLEEFLLVFFLIAGSEETFVEMMIWRVPASVSARHALKHPHDFLHEKRVDN